MNGGPNTDATLGRTARAALEHLRRQSGFATWLLTRTNDFEQIVIAAVDPQFSIVANSVLPNDLSTDRFLANVSKLEIPVQLSNGLHYGSLIGLSRQAPGPMAPHAESLLPLMANMLGALAGAEAAVAASTRQAERSGVALDALTGTATRQSWEAQLIRDDERCNANGEQAWIIIICLDELHELNKRHGHDAGDEVLAEFGKLLNTTLQGRHMCARITGLQFGVLAVDISAAEATALETQLRQTLSATGIAAWVGVGRRLPGVGLGAALDAAEASICVARSAVSLDSSTFDEATADLVNALDRGEIRAYFQPIVDMRTGDVVAIEALARWQTDNGIREPYEFLPGSSGLG